MSDNADRKELKRLAQANKDRLADSKKRRKDFVSSHNKGVADKIAALKSQARQMRKDAENSGNVNEAFFKKRRKLLEKAADLKMGMK